MKTPKGFVRFPCFGCPVLCTGCGGHLIPEDPKEQARWNAKRRESQEEAQKKLKRWRLSKF